MSEVSQEKLEIFRKELEELLEKHGLNLEAVATLRVTEAKQEPTPEPKEETK